MAFVLVKIWNKKRGSPELELCLFKTTFIQNEKFFRQCARKSGLGEGVYSSNCGRMPWKFSIVDIFFESNWLSEHGEYETDLDNAEIRVRLDKFIKLISQKFQIEIEY